MATLQKQTKTQVIAHVRKYGSWHGVICGAKMFPIIGQTAMYLDLVFDSDYDVCVKDETMIDFSSEDYQRIPRTLDDWYNNWSYYNTSYEEGYYAAFYMLVKG